MPAATNRTARALVLVAILLLASACDGAATAPSQVVEDGATQPSPAGPVATPDLVDGLADDTGLVPPDPETGEVPPAEPASQPMTGSLTLGAAATLVEGIVDGAGGSLKVAKAGDPLDGLEIEVPAGTYDRAVAFTVAASPIDASTFGAAITPLSPLVRVDNAGAVATGGPVLVTIPAAIPDGAGVGGFYYLEATGTLSPLPVVGQTPTSVTLAVEHFSDIFLALIDWSKIAEVADSGFRPGVDDWQFTNYGSFIAPGGHCEGQVVSAMWYYLNQHLAGGASPLYGLYDNNGDERTATFWADDSDGYRLASAVQASPISMPKVYGFFKSLGTAPGTFAYNTFRAAIAITGEPHLMAIADSAGGHGHAIIAYRVAGNRIFVADPNYPGRLRTIAYDPATGVLGPYSSGDSAGSIATNGAVSYTRFALIPKTASAADANVAGLWAEFENGKVGSSFPAYGLESWEGQDEDGNDIWTAIESGYNAPEAKLRVRLVAPGGEQMTMAVYRGTGTRPEKGWGTELTIDLKDGANELGFYVKGARDGAWRYVDFERMTINRGLIDINGSWTGTLTFTDITVDPEVLKEAEDQGCTVAILEELRGMPLPVTFDITADEEGTGDATMVIDASALAETDDEQSTSDPVVMSLVYKDGKITFDLDKACGADAACAMTGTPAARKDKPDVITGTISMSGAGYSATAEFMVERD